MHSQKERYLWVTVTLATKWAWEGRGIEAQTATTTTASHCTHKTATSSSGQKHKRTWTSGQQPSTVSLISPSRRKIASVSIRFGYFYDWKFVSYINFKPFSFNLTAPGYLCRPVSKHFGPDAMKFRFRVHPVKMRALSLPLSVLWWQAGACEPLSKIC